MAAQSPSAIVSRNLATQYGRAAPDLLAWSQERQFFQIQIGNVTKNNKSVEAAVAHNVERTIESLRDAALTCASMGLSMNPIAQLVYFIPRRERTFNEDIDASKADYEKNVPWIIYPSPSYRGLAFICTRYAGADDVAAEVVFKADVFKPRGPFALPFHEPTTNNEQRKWEHAIGVYCGIRWPGGRERSEYLDANMIAIIRSKSDRPGAMMWDPKQLWTEGWKKAAVRRASKLGIQGNPRLDAAELNMRTHEGVTIDGEAREVPRGTSPTDPPPKPRRGMGGLGETLKTSEAKQDAAQGAEEAARAAEAAAAQGPVAQSVEQPEKPSTPVGSPGGEVGTVAGSTPAGASAQETYLAALGLRGGRHEGDPCKHCGKPHDEVEPGPCPGAPRPNTLDWWRAKIAGVKNRRELEQLRDEAIAAGVDTGPYSDDFTIAYRKKSQALRLARTQQQTQGGLL